MRFSCEHFCNSRSVQQVAITFKGGDATTAPGQDAMIATHAAGSGYELTFDTAACVFCTVKSSAATVLVDDVTQVAGAAALQAALEGLANVGAGEVTVVGSVVEVAADEIAVTYDITFGGDAVRGNLQEVFEATPNTLSTSPGSLTSITNLVISTTSEGNQPSGSVYLRWDCEKRTVTVSTGVANVIAIDGSASDAVFVHDVVRINESGSGLSPGTTDWHYYKVIEAVHDGTNTWTLNIDRALDAAISAAGTYVAEVGVFTSSDSTTYGVSTGCGRSC